ncbi:hypothetical protein [Sphingomonas jaspsi]|uniref:hypothetical protein n=1 Tax=Sphingomonas jaspsi TaxID=392409 RepID=UPI0004BCFB2C|nr:hypothetical protein [Sphingomonas jaspsi]
MNTLSKLLGWAALIVGLLYILALGLWLIGTYGLFGQERDPLSAVFLIPLGLPWNQWGEGLAVALAAPAANVVILWLLSALLRPKN